MRPDGNINHNLQSFIDLQPFSFNYLDGGYKGQKGDKESLERRATITEHPLSFSCGKY